MISAARSLEWKAGCVNRSLGSAYKHSLGIADLLRVGNQSANLFNEGVEGVFGACDAPAGLVLPLDLGVVL